MAQTVPSFVENGPKLRVLIPLKWEWSETAENRGEPRKNDLLLGNKTWLGGSPNGKVVATGILLICPVDENRDYHTRK